MNNTGTSYGTKRINRLFKFSFSLMVVLLMSVFQTNAQIPTEVPSSKTGMANAASLLTQFMGAIKPSSFTDQWKTGKSSWLSSVGKIAGAPGIIENISSLAKFIKPSMFKNGFNVQDLLQTASSAKSVVDATGLLKNLEAGLKPEAMASSWSSKRNSWLSALSLLK